MTTRSPLAGKRYGPDNFRSLNAAYSQYQSDRLLHGGGEAQMAPRDEFAQIWGWTPGLTVGKKEPSRYMPRGVARP